MRFSKFAARALASALLVSTLFSVTAMAAPVGSTTTAVRINKGSATISSVQTVTAAQSDMTLSSAQATGSFEIIYQSQDGSETSATVTAMCPDNVIYGYVSAQGDGLRVRQGPGTTYEILATVTDGSVFAITGKTDGWYQISYNGRTAYVSADYLVENETGTLVPDNGNASEDGTIGSIAPPQSFDGELAQRIVSYALQFKGFPYVYGTAGPSTFDCSGFTSYVYKQFGYTLNRSSRDQINNGVPVSKAELQPGDLLFFSNNGVHPTHVGLYIGDGDFIHASTPKSGVKIDSLYSNYYSNSDYYFGARRII